MYEPNVIFSEAVAREII